MVSSSFFASIRTINVFCNNYNCVLRSYKVIERRLRLSFFRVLLKYFTQICCKMWKKRRNEKANKKFFKIFLWVFCKRHKNILFTCFSWKHKDWFKNCVTLLRLIAHFLLTFGDIVSDPFSNVTLSKMTSFPPELTLKLFKPDATFSDVNVNPLS